MSLAQQSRLWPLHMAYQFFKTKLKFRIIHKHLNSYLWDSYLNETKQELLPEIRKAGKYKMRKFIVLSFITLDGVIQAPGSPEEDPSGGFPYGGWVAPYSDEVSDRIMVKLMQPADLLLGRKTFEIWESYWPEHAGNWPRINEVTKYVVSGSRHATDWVNTVFLQSIEDIKNLKSANGPDIKVWGSGTLVQELMSNELVDELWLMIHPVMLGNGKKLFADSPVPAAFDLKESTATPSGVIIAHYQKAGEIRTGTVGA